MAAPRSLHIRSCKLVKEAAEVGRSVADQVAPLGLEVDRSLDQDVNQEVPEPVMEL